jgi:DNA-directed RNA polymerase specialized sigma24 family protein
MGTGEETSFFQSGSLDDASVSEWVRDLKQGDAEAAQQLWNRYFEQLVTQAQRRLRKHNCPEGAVVPEDVAVSVFESIWRGANAGRFHNVNDRDELWWLLQALTHRKVVDHIRHATAQRRFPGHVPQPLAGSSSGAGFRELMAQEPTPEYLAILEEQYLFLLGLLRDSKLREIAVLKVEGWTSDEICEQLSVSSATMNRKLKLIRTTWQQALADQDLSDGDRR